MVDSNFKMIWIPFQRAQPNGELWVKLKSFEHVQISETVPNSERQINTIIQKGLALKFKFSNLIEFQFSTIIGCNITGNN